MKILIELIILLPLAGAVANLLAGRQLPRRWSETMACAAVWGSCAATIAAAAAYSSPLTVNVATWLMDFDLVAPMTLRLDPLSLSLVLMVTFVCGLIHLYSVPYMAREPGHVRYFALLNLFVAAMLLLLLAENLPLLYMGWEGVGFCSYGLIGYWYRDERNATAARKAFIVTRIGDVGLGVAIIWLYELFSTTSITVINDSAFLMPLMVITPIGLLLLVGAMGKSAQLPLMVWLPDAMAGPTPVSAMIHAATMVTAGVYLLMRLFPLVSLSPQVMGAIAVTGALSAFYGASCAVAQRDLKRVLAYSTISQIGFMMLGVGAGAVVAATFHLIVHAFFKALLFLAAGCVITAMHHEQDIYRMGGLSRSLPSVHRLFLAGGLCLAGFPLSGGFFSKDAILGAVWERGGWLYPCLYLLGLATAFLTAYYTFRMIFLVFGGHGPVPHPLHRLMIIPLVPLALLGLAGGLLNLPHYLGEGLIGGFLASGGVRVEHASASTELLLQGVAAVTAIAGILLAWRRYSGENRTVRIAEAEQPAMGLSAFLLGGWYVDRLYAFLFVRPFVRLSTFLWQRVDAGMIDDSLDRMAEWLGRGGVQLGRWSSGRVSLYLIFLAMAAAILMGWLAMAGAGGG